MSSNPPLSKEEAELYDRQIRLWGHDSQQRITNAKILVLGFGGLASEIAKNMVLAGINTMTIVDWKKAEEIDLSAHLFLSQDSIGTNRALASIHELSEMNTHAKVSAVDIEDEARAIEYLKSNNDFDFVVDTELSFENKVIVNEYCRELSKNPGSTGRTMNFIAAQCLGRYTYSFFDLNGYAHVNRETNEKQILEYPSLSQSMNAQVVVDRYFCKFYFVLKALYNFTTHNHARILRLKDNAYSIAQDIFHSILKDSQIEPNDEYDKLFEHAWTNFGYEVNVGCSVTAGIVSQEIIKAISFIDSPLKNFFFYDVLTGENFVESII